MNEETKNLIYSCLGILAKSFQESVYSSLLMLPFELDILNSMKEEYLDANASKKISIARLYFKYIIDKKDKLRTYSSEGLKVHLFFLIQKIIDLQKYDDFVQYKEALSIMNYILKPLEHMRNELLNKINEIEIIEINPLKRVVSAVFSMSNNDGILNNIIDGINSKKEESYFGLIFFMNENKLETLTNKNIRDKMSVFQFFQSLLNTMLSYIEQNSVAGLYLLSAIYNFYGITNCWQLIQNHGFISRFGLFIKNTKDSKILITSLKIIREFTGEEVIKRFLSIFAEKISDFDDSFSKEFLEYFNDCKRIIQNYDLSILANNRNTHRAFLFLVCKSGQIDNYINKIFTQNLSIDSLNRAVNYLINNSLIDNNNNDNFSKYAINKIMDEIFNTHKENNESIVLLSSLANIMKRIKLSEVFLAFAKFFNGDLNNFTIQVLETINAIIQDKKEESKKCSCHLVVSDVKNKYVETVYSCLLKLLKTEDNFHKIKIITFIFNNAVGMQKFDYFEQINDNSLILSKLIPDSYQKNIFEKAFNDIKLDSKNIALQIIILGLYNPDFKPFEEISSILNDIKSSPPINQFLINLFINFFYSYPSKATKNFKEFIEKYSEYPMEGNYHGFLNFLFRTPNIVIDDWVFLEILNKISSFNLPSQDRKILVKLLILFKEKENFYNVLSKYLTFGDFDISEFPELENIILSSEYNVELIPDLLKFNLSNTQLDNLTKSIIEYGESKIFNKFVQNAKENNISISNICSQLLKLNNIQKLIEFTQYCIKYIKEESDFDLIFKLSIIYIDNIFEKDVCIHCKNALCNIYSNALNDESKSKVQFKIDIKNISDFFQNIINRISFEQIKQIFSLINESSTDKQYSYSTLIFIKISCQYFQNELAKTNNSYLRKKIISFILNQMNKLNQPSMGIKRISIEIIILIASQGNFKEIISQILLNKHNDFIRMLIKEFSNNQNFSKILNQSFFEKIPKLSYNKDKILNEQLQTFCYLIKHNNDIKFYPKFIWFIIFSFTYIQCLDMKNKENLEKILREIFNNLTFSSVSIDYSNVNQKDILNDLNNLVQSIFKLTLPEIEQFLSCKETTPEWKIDKKDFFFYSCYLLYLLLKEFISYNYSNINISLTELIIKYYYKLDKINLQKFSKYLNQFLPDELNLLFKSFGTNKLRTDFTKMVLNSISNEYNNFDQELKENMLSFLNNLISLLSNEEKNDIIEEIFLIFDINIDVSGYQKYILMIFNSLIKNNISEKTLNKFKNSNNYSISKLLILSLSNNNEIQKESTELLITLSNQESVRQTIDDNIYIIKGLANNNEGDICLYGTTLADWGKTNGVSTRLLKYLKHIAGLVKNSKNKQKLANKLNIILSPIINSDKRTQIDWINQRNLAIDIMCTLSYQCNP